MSSYRRLGEKVEKSSRNPLSPSTFLTRGSRLQHKQSDKRYALETNLETNRLQGESNGDRARHCFFTRGSLLRSYALASVLGISGSKAMALLRKHGLRSASCAVSIEDIRYGNTTHQGSQTPFSKALLSQAPGSYFTYMERSCTVQEFAETWEDGVYILSVSDGIGPHAVALRIADRKATFVDNFARTPREIPSVYLRNQVTKFWTIER